MATETAQSFRIEGVTLPANKHLVISLTELYGIGRSTAKKICADTQIDPTKKVRDLDDAEKRAIKAAIDALPNSVEGNLRRKVIASIKRLMDIGSYRGKRHRAKLPLHGQRSRTNAMTAKKKAGTNSKSKK